MVSNGLVRIIPARAGFTWYNPPSAPLHPDHPRSRGVYVQMARSCVSRTGSSPLARGLLLPLEIRVWDGGIIPARAGFTGVGNIQVEHFRDHPRSRGVYSPDASPRRTPRGSSPLARGLLLRISAEAHDVRIIPARAGFTASPSRSPRPRRDHPRSRGVYTWAAAPSCPTYGSSPLARGLRSAHRGVALPDRIIPARAGFTRRPSPEPSGARDHPRSRGVYPIPPRPFTDGEGSSPLARGLHVEGARREVLAGIIPARAGFTLADPWNPNDEAPYQTAFAFTADLALAPQSSDSVVVLQQSTRTPSEP